MEKFQTGDTIAAEKLLRDALAATKQRFGDTSPQVASAYNDLALLMLNLNQPDEAIEALRAALAIPSSGKQEDLKDAITYEMNLATMLQNAGELAEAEQVFQKNLENRLRFYGREHPGYAFGLEPYAALLMQQNRVEEALPVLSEVVENFWNNQHPRIAGAIALRGEALKQAGDPTPPFAGMDGLPDEVIVEIATAVIGRYKDCPPAIYRLILADLRLFLKERIGEKHDTYRRILGTIINFERLQEEQQDHGRRIEAVETFLRLAEEERNTERMIEALQGLSLALDDAGRVEDALAAGARGVTLAEQLGKPATLSNMLRNHGLALSQAGHRAEAEPILRRALAVAERSRDKGMLGSAQVALGVFVQHDGRLQEARPLLEAAIRHLEPASSEALVAGSHLNAILTGGSCGCGDMSGVMEETIRDLIVARLPEGFVRELTVKLTDDGIETHFDFARELSDAEKEQVDMAVRHGVEAFRSTLERSNIRGR